jgi:protein subunit release factor A
MKLLKKDIRIDFYSGTGKGGQNRNRHYNCVRIKHMPTGIIVTASEERSQSQNLEAAMERMGEKLSALVRKKKKRVATKMPKAARDKILRSKKRKSEKKISRKKENEIYE